MNPFSKAKQLLLSPSYGENLQYGLSFAVCMLAIFALHGQPVPFNTEYFYLPRLFPDFLPNDWSFSEPAYEHWLFNVVFSVPARFLSLEVIGWLGRILTWTICLFGLMKLGRQFQIPYWQIAVGILLWLGLNQANINIEWIFGGFEAKAVAYSFLVISLWLFTEGKLATASVLLGLTFSFHPAVGLWAVPAVGFALILEITPIKNLFLVIGLTSVFMFPGLVPVLLGHSEMAGSASYDDWKFVVTELLPYHLDPFQFVIRELALLFVMFVFNVVALWGSSIPALRFLARFQLALGMFFFLGILLRLFEVYPLLRFMPMRVLPVFAALFFVFAAFHLFRKMDSATNRIRIAVFGVAVVALADPFVISIPRFRRHVAMRVQASKNDLTLTYEWVSKNTELDALIIGPPSAQNMWYVSRRAAIASRVFPLFDRLPEWRERVRDLTGAAELPRGFNSKEAEDAFNELPAEHVEYLRKKYGGSYLISKATHSYPVVFSTETYRVYRLVEP